MAAGFDIAVRRIPNTLILVGLGLGFVAQYVADSGHGLLRGGIGAGAALAVLMGPFALRALGGGDVKLGMVVGAWTSLWTWINIFLAAALLTGAISFLYWLYQYYRTTDSPPRVPVAVPVALATIAITTRLFPPLIPGP